MIMIAASKMRLEPGEALADPILAGVARVTKKIGDREYHAWVDSRDVGLQGETPYLQCFPHHHSRTHGSGDTVTIGINEWTDGAL